MPCSGLPKSLFGGVGRPLEPLFQPLHHGGGSKGRLPLFCVFHAYSMTKPLALSQSVPVTVTVTVSVQGVGGGGGGAGCQPF